MIVCSRERVRFPGGAIVIFRFVCASSSGVTKSLSIFSILKSSTPQKSKGKLDDNMKIKGILRVNVENGYQAMESSRGALTISIRFKVSGK